MNPSLQKFRQWIQKTGYDDPDDVMIAGYIQVVSILFVVSAMIIGVVYAYKDQFFYVAMACLTMVIYGCVIGMIRMKLLRIAAGLFLIAALGSLTFGIFSVGGIHASASLLYPFVLLFAGLLLDRKSYIVYLLLCLASIGFIIYMEDHGLTPVPYVPDPPDLALFVTYLLIIICFGVVLRLIAEDLRGSSRRARQFAREIVTQKALLDRVGQAVIGCSMDNTIIYWNQAAAELYGWTSDEAIGKQYYDLFRAAMTLDMGEKIRRVLQHGRVWSGELKIQNRNHEKLHILGTVAPLHSDEKTITGWVTTATNLTDRNRIEQGLRQRESILETVAFAAEQFLKISDWRTAVDEVLARLGLAIDATHAYLFEDHLNSKGEPVTSMRYEWTAPGYESDLDKDHFQNSLIDQEGYEEQVSKLHRGEIRSGTASTFTPIEQEAMLSMGVKSILEVPIFVNGREWGAIGFDDFENEREWSVVEVDALKIAAGILSGAIQRQETETAVRESERIYHQAIEAAGAVPYIQKHGVDTYQFIGQGIEQLTGYRADEMTLSLWRSLLQAEQMSGELAGLDVNVAVERVRKGEIKYWKCDNLVRAKDGSLRWLADTAVDLYDHKGVSYGAVGFIQDITERKRTEERLIQREALWETITFAAEQFLRNTDWRMGIDIALERIGKAIKVTHAYLFENHINENGVTMFMLAYEWTAPGHKSSFENPYYQTPHPVNTDPHSAFEKLRNGKLFFGNASNFPEPEKERLLAAGIKGLVEMPLLVDGIWWGTMGFDDMEVERDWNTAEMDALKIAGDVLSAAIQRQKAEVAVRESERIYRQAIEAAGAVPYYQVYGIDQYQFMGEGIRTMLGYEPEEMTASFWDRIVQEYDFVGEMRGRCAEGILMK